MGKTTLKASNVHKPAPRWWRKAEDIVFFVLVPVVTIILQSWGFTEAQQKNVDRANLIIAVALPVFMKGMGKVLANGEEYIQSDETEEEVKP